MQQQHHLHAQTASHVHSNPIHQHSQLLLNHQQQLQPAHNGGHVQLPSNVPASGSGVNDQATRIGDQLQPPALDLQQQSMLYWQMMQQGAFANPAQVLSSTQHPSSSPLQSKPEPPEASNPPNNHTSTNSLPAPPPNPQLPQVPPVAILPPGDTGNAFTSQATLNNILHAFTLVQNGFLAQPGAAAAAVAAAAGQLGGPLAAAINPAGQPIVTTVNYIDPPAAPIPTSSSPQPPTEGRRAPLMDPVNPTQQTAREKNRIAQQRFREKQKRQIMELTAELSKVQKRYDDSLKEIASLKEENKTLKAKLGGAGKL